MYSFVALTSILSFCIPGTSNEIIREKIINRFDDRSYFSYFEKIYVAFGNTPIYNIIIRGLLKSLVTLNYFQQSEKVFYKGL